MNEIEKAIAYEIDDIVGEYQVEFDNGEIRKGTRSRLNLMALITRQVRWID